MVDWAKPRGFAKKEIDWAGEILTSADSSDEDSIRAYEILDNWRAIHSYPMHVFNMRIRTNLPRIDSSGIGVQRLKRVPAILAKLDRSKRGTLRKLALSQLQDVGGCRAILSSVQSVRRFCEDVFHKSRLKHKLVTEKDYIKEPRESGYRGIHLVYSFYSDKRNKSIYNGLLVEIQIRSRLQHLWATAVETAGLFIQQALKSSEADIEWLDFFRLVSSAVAIMEGCRSVKDSPKFEQELFLEIKKREKELNLIAIMDGWRRAVKIIEDVIKRKTIKKFQFYILQLDIANESLDVFGYARDEEAKAIEKYSQLEKANKLSRRYDIVLVGADTPSDLKKAYPNYFVDTQDFLDILKQIIAKY